MKYQLADHISLTQVDDEAVLLDLNSGAYYGLNHVGALFINYLLKDYSNESAYKEIVKQYDVCAETASRDLDSLVKQLLDQKLVIESDSQTDQ